MTKDTAPPNVPTLAPSSVRSNVVEAPASRKTEAKGPALNPAGTVIGSVSVSGHRPVFVTVNVLTTSVPSRVWSNETPDTSSMTSPPSTDTSISGTATSLITSNSKGFSLASSLMIETSPVKNPVVEPSSVRSNVVDAPGARSVVANGVALNPAGAEIGFESVMGHRPSFVTVNVLVTSVPRRVTPKSITENSLNTCWLSTLTVISGSAAIPVTLKANGDSSASSLTNDTVPTMVAWKVERNTTSSVVDSPLASSDVVKPVVP